MSKVSVVREKVVTRTVTITLTEDQAKQLMALVGSGQGLIDGLYAKLSEQGLINDKYRTLVKYPQGWGLGLHFASVDIVRR